MRLIGLAVLVLNLALWPLAAEAQRAAEVARIGWLALNLAAALHVPESFRQGLRDLGYVEGRNVVIEYRDAEGKPERLPALAAELVALKVDVILAAGTPQALAAQHACKAWWSDSEWERTDSPHYCTSRIEHSPTSATGTGWERTPWHATQWAAGGMTRLICFTSERTTRMLP